MKDDSFDCTLIAHLRIFLLFYRLLYCLILPENRLFFGIWKVVEIDYEYYHMHEKNHYIYNIVKDVIMRMQKTFRDMVKKEGTFIAPDDFSEVIDNGKAFIDPGVKMGEGWLLTGEVVSLIKSGVTNVISAQPFGCLPNHIVAKGMVRKIKDEYPKANIVAIDYDPSASKVNQENRIRLMLANAKLSEEMKASV